jgi:hypothetical protein
MKYSCGTEIKLNDLVTVNVPKGDFNARVAMLGETYEYSNLDKDFIDWVTKDKVLQTDGIVVEWSNTNPFEHNDPKYSPVGNYMFTSIDYTVVFKQRGIQGVSI